MKIETLLPVVIMAESFCASIFYACVGDFNKAGYWLCCAGITYFVLRI